jgi:hypothetical protein
MRAERLLIVVLSMAIASIAKAETRAMCDQNVSFELSQLDAEVKPDLKAWQGIWLGTSESGACIGVVVEKIDSNGAVSFKSFIGKYVSNQGLAQPSASELSGRIDGRVLKAITPNQAELTYKIVGAGRLEVLYVTSRGGFLRGQVTKQ